MSTSVLSAALSAPPKNATTTTSLGMGVPTPVTKVPVTSTSPSCSLKQLCHLVTGQGVDAADQVVQKELTAVSNTLENGVSGYIQGSVSTRACFKAKRKVGKLTSFLLELSDVLGVEEEQSKTILSTYLAGEFRGTKSSLKKLIDDDRFHCALLHDVWQFYRAERLYLLQVLKCCVDRGQDKEAGKEFKHILDRINDQGNLLKSLLEQFRAVISEEVPSRETNGKYFGDNLLHSWAHSNLREQAELLQIILILLQCHSKASVDVTKTLTDFLDLCHLHGFGRKQKSAHLHVNLEQDLVDSIGQLEAVIITGLIDLPALTTLDASDHAIFKDSKIVEKLDKSFNGLGSLAEHGPIMLSWMLAHYLADGEESLGKYHALGERALQLRAVHFLDRAVESKVLSSNHVVNGLAKGTCYATACVLVTAFEPQRMGLVSDVQSLGEKLFTHEALADDLWKQGYEIGLGTHFASVLSGFPAETKPLLDLSFSLASAGSHSAEQVFACFERMSVYCEPLEKVPSDHIQMKGVEQFVSTTHRCPSDFCPEIIIRCGSIGVIDGNTFKWNTNFNGWQYLLAEMELLGRQVSSGSQNVSSHTMANVLGSIKLFQAVFENSSLALQRLRGPVSQNLFILIEKFAHIANPPLELMASALQVLSLVTREQSMQAWERLSKTGLFPHASNNVLGSDRNNLNSINSGLVGLLLAQQESVNGEYPLISAFLDLLLQCVKTTEEVTGNRHHPAAASVVYVVQDIFPSYQQWRFANSVEKETFGQKILLLYNAILSKPESSLANILCECLRQAAPTKTLLSLVGTGDRMIQSLIEAQSSWDAGVGKELAGLVSLAMTVFEHLLQQSNMEDFADLNRHLCSPAPGGKPHFLLTISHYIYHLQSCDIPVAAMRLLATIARIFPMSLLACLGSDAEAVRDVLIYRLGSHTESVRLKVAIVDFFSACIDGQPGFIQLLIGTSEEVSVVNSKPSEIKQVNAAVKTGNEQVKLVSESGCLTPILAILKNSKEYSESNEDLSKLHLSTTFFILHLWSQQRVVAMEHLKQQESFWNDITWTLFQIKGRKKTKLNACIFRILASEIYTYGGKVDKRLQDILEKFCDDKAEHLSDWCQLVLDQLAVNGSAQMEETFITPAPTVTSDDFVSLLGAWKAFLIVLSKDQPVTVKPSQCHLVASKFIKAIRLQLSSTTDKAENNARIITSMSEVCLVLMQRWQTKCADNMEDWCTEQLLLLEELSVNFDELHPRSRAAILAIVNTALRTSSFKLDKEEDVLVKWLEPAADVVIKSFYHFENRNVDTTENTRKASHPQQVPILALSLLRNLIQRFSDPALWFSVLHRKVLVQALLSKLHHSLKRHADTDVLHSVLGLLLIVAKCEMGAHTLLTSDLAQLLWLPLSEVRQATPEWVPVFQLGIQLATTLLRVGKHEAVENTVTVVALLQEQITTFLLAPKVSIQQSHIELMVTSVTLIAKFMKYHKQWQLKHPATLVHFYHTMSSLLHLSTCLLTRPSLLDMMISRSRPSEANPAASDEELERVRRMSSTEAELDSQGGNSCPETAYIQNALLDAICSGLSMLRALSPDLVEVASGDLFDHEQYEQLLGIGFSSPTFEQEDGLTYGTLVSVANLCIRTLTRAERSPSPSSSATATPTVRHGLMDRKRLSLVLEQVFIVLLSQALLFLSDPKPGAREKQFVKRELGAELSSFIESMRRYSHRGGAGSSRSPQLGGSASPGSGVARSNSKIDEQFMKLVSSIVQSVFSS